MEQNRKLSLAPLQFKEAVSDLLKVKPEPKARPPKTRKDKKGPGNARAMS
jgi:hypothetical protein